MPKIYEGIRNSCIAEGGSIKFCKTKAAKIYNSMRAVKPSLPVLSNKHKSKKK